MTRERRTIHVIGAGLAGLCAAVNLASSGANVVVHEATNQGGGRCRSYYDSIFGSVLDNGNHLILSGNAGTLQFLETIGAHQTLVEPQGRGFFSLTSSLGARGAFGRMTAFCRGGLLFLRAGFRRQAFGTTSQPLAFFGRGHLLPWETRLAAKVASSKD